jgi:putative membrane protein
MAAMTPRLYRYLQGFVMILFSIFLLQKILSGKLDWYIHQRFMPLTVLAVIVLLVIGITVFRMARNISQEEAHDHGHEQQGNHQHEHRESGWGPVIVSIPLLIGVLIPAQPLTSSAMTGKGLSSAPPIASNSSAAVSFDQAPDDRNILDWIRLFGSPDMAGSYLGQTANVTGFVYHDPRLKDGQFLVSRFAIVCCTADAFAIGMVVDWPKSASLPDDQWVKVKGTVESTQLADQTLPLIRANSIEPVQVPDQPYLFP